LSDAQKGEATHDLNLFVLALLASSLFIYNTKGTIDASALDGLHLAARVGEDLVKDPKEMDTFAQHCPHFLWAIRDHHLELEIDGKSVTADGYLEHCLKGKENNEPNVKSYNAYRDVLKKCFPQRHCIVFPHPPKEMKNLNKLDKLDDSDLALEFTKATDEFITFVKNTAKPKQVKGAELSGHGFAVMMKNFLDSLLKKQISIPSTYSFVVDAENRKALDNAFASLQKLLETELSSMPVSTEQFTRVMEKAMTTSNKVFLDSCMNIRDPKSQQFLAELNERIQQELVGREQDNLKVSEQKCKAILNDLYKPIEAKMNNTFMAAGGYNLLKPEIDNLKMAYLQRSLEDEFGPCKGKVLKEFDNERVRLTL
jgi:hypothetical protein